MSNSLPDQRIVVIEGSPYDTPQTRSFASADEAAPYVIERVRATVRPELQARLDKALADRIVSEDGKEAVSEVLAGKLAFLRALATHYGRHLSIVTQTAPNADEDKDERD